MSTPYIPPKLNPAFCVPHPASKSLGFIRPPPADHAAPSYSSVVVDGALPPKLSPAFCVPHPANLSLATARLPPADHAAPSYSSVIAEEAPVSPPKLSPAFCVPHPAKSCLAVASAPPATQNPKTLDFNTHIVDLLLLVRFAFLTILSALVSVRLVWSNTDAPKSALNASSKYVAGTLSVIALSMSEAISASDLAISGSVIALGNLGIYYHSIT